MKVLTIAILSVCIFNFAAGSLDETTDLFLKYEVVGIESFIHGMGGHFFGVSAECKKELREPMSKLLEVINHHHYYSTELLNICLNLFSLISKTVTKCDIFQEVWETVKKGSCYSWTGIFKLWKNVSDNFEEIKEKGFQAFGSLKAYPRNTVQYVMEHLFKNLGEIVKIALK